MTVKQCELKICECNANIALLKAQIELKQIDIIKEQDLLDSWKEELDIEKRFEAKI